MIVKTGLMRWMRVKIPRERFDLRKPLDWDNAVKVDPSKEDKILDWLKQFGYEIHTSVERFEKGEIVICGEPMVSYIFKDNYLLVRYACFRRHGYTLLQGNAAPVVPIRSLFDTETERAPVDAVSTFWGSMPFIGFSDNKFLLKAKRAKTSKQLVG